MRHVSVVHRAALWVYAAAVVGYTYLLLFMLV